MTPLVRFLFDECVSKPATIELMARVGGGFQFGHISGEKDRDWIPRIAAEGQWVVITSDCGKQSTHPDRLPRICAEHKVTHLLLTQRVHRLPMAEKVERLFEMWDRIVELGSYPAGSRFRLRYLSVKGSGSQVRLDIEHVDLTKRKKRRG